MVSSQGSDFQSIPLFNLDEFKDHPREFTLRLRRVCHEVGFFYIQNHGIQLDFMKKMLELTVAFFDLPLVEKEKLKISLSPHFRGYGRLQQEMTGGMPDFKESYDLGLEQEKRNPSADQPFLSLQGPNLWPDLPCFVQLEWKETVIEYLRQLQKLGEYLMIAMSQALGLTACSWVEQFRADSEDAFALLRLLRYPPSKTGSEGFGVGPHIDSGCLVILLQDDVGGLQVQNRKGEWIDAPPIPGTFVVNIGKMLQIWSSHYFLATPHRVLNSRWKVRHSIPFFFEPKLTTVVRPIKLPVELQTEFIGQESDSSVIYGEYMLNVFKRSFPGV